MDIAIIGSTWLVVISVFSYMLYKHFKEYRNNDDVIQNDERMINDFYIKKD